MTVIISTGEIPGAELLVCSSSTSTSPIQITGAVASNDLLGPFPNVIQHIIVRLALSTMCIASDKNKGYEYPEEESANEIYERVKTLDCLGERIKDNTLVTNARFLEESLINQIMDRFILNKNNPDNSFVERNKIRSSRDDLDRRLNAICLMLFSFPDLEVFPSLDSMNLLISRGGLVDVQKIHILNRLMEGRKISTWI